MSLIDKFENMPFQDVGTFNSIFVVTPILGFDFDTTVEIKEMVNSKRRVIVGDVELFLDLSQKQVLKKEPTVEKTTPKTKTKRVCDRKKISLPTIYKTLRPTEFLVYSAIKELQEVDGVEELSRNIGISNKTIALSVKRLAELSLVKVEYVACAGGSFNKITMVQ